MKKKITAVLATLVTALALTGCTNSATDQSTMYDNYDETVFETLGFNNKDTWTELKAFESDATDYTTVKVAQNPNLYVTYTDLDSTIEEYGDLVKSVNVPALAFSNLRDDTKDSLISELYNEEYGITASKIGLASTHTLNVKSYNLTGVSIADAKAKFNEGSKGNTLSIVYLPVYVKQQKSGKTYAVSYVLVPVYYEISTKAAFDASNYEELNATTVVDKETGLLKNKVSE